ncbi:serine/threonine protein kinase [Microbacterium sp. LMI1-1-1.1]|uniref:serine/threonine protein kinase n=1 Tax=Microbacterium sp. LMI1-1-1.1 TaxID=3135223 RepID=UPI003465E53A
MADPITSGSGGEELVAGRFRVSGLLGSGATASVYAATDVRSAARVALKVLHPHLVGERALSAAFLREAQVVEGIRHPGLCALRGWGGGDGDATTWTAWDLVDGRSLGEVVRAEGPLTPEAATAMARRILDGLDALHTAGLVHRDVSPANVLVDLAPDGGLRDARLVDYGLTAPGGETAHGADVLRSTTGDGVVGNVGYASPEQLRGEGVGPAGDLYQLGGVLYFALVGRPPFDRATTDEVVRAHLGALPPTPSVSAPRVPVALDRVVVRALLKDPSARFADAPAMRKALAEAMPSPGHRAGRGTAGAVAADADATRLLAAGPGAAAPAAAAPATAPVTASAPALPAPPASTAPPAASRSTSPWLWILAGTAAAVVVAVVAVAARPSPAPAGETAPAPSVVAPAASVPPPSPTTSATAASSAPPPATVALPELRGLPLADAVALLGRLGLQPGTVTAMDGTDAADTILQTGVAAGAALALGTPVDLTVASGWNAVPGIVGLQERDAVERVSAAGLTPVVVREPHAGIAGTVVGTDAAASPRLVLGSPVVLTVATAPTPAPTATPTAGPTPTATPTPGATP